LKELLIQNEWWDTGKISQEKAKPYRRKVFEEIKRTFQKYRQILLLTGLRRVGKTTLLYQLIQELLRAGIKPTQLIYFSFDMAVKDPLEIFGAYERITKVDFRREKVYAFLDEIQKLPDWSRKIKFLYDNLPNIKLCLSGSASLTIERKAIEDLAGRYFPVQVKFLTLQEFAELYYSRQIDNFELYRPKLEAIFDDYIERPFPEIVGWKEKEKVSAYLRELVIERIIKSDTIEVFKKVNIPLLSSLAELLIRNSGSILNMEALAKDLHVHKLTLAAHIYYLKFGKLIHIVRNYRPSIRAESRKLPKIYAAHPALLFAYYASLDKGKIVENLVMGALELSKYFKLGAKEIDFLKINKVMLPIEVKAKQTLSRGDLKPLLWFLDKYKLKKGIVIYFGEEVERRFNRKTIRFLPLHKVLFNFKI
jgi:hypothetical protein